jgi:hypothetical protein
MAVEQRANIKFCLKLGKTAREAYEMMKSEYASASRLRERRNNCMVLMGKPEGKRPVGRPKVNGRIILRRVLEKQDVLIWDGSIWFRRGISRELL